LGQTTTPGGATPSQPISPTGTALPSALLPAAGPFCFSDSTVRLPAGAQDGTTEIILRSSTPQVAAPALKDVELPQPLAAKVTFEPIPDTNAPPNTWRYRATVYGLTLATNQQHYAVVNYAGNKTQPLFYTVTNQPAGTFSWSISKLPDPWVSSYAAGACTAFTVTAKDASATDVKVYSTLIEQTTKQAITLQDLRLCPVGNKCDGTQPIDLAANVPTAFQLCTTKGFHGKFDGSVVLTSRQKPDGDVIVQHTQFSSDRAKLVGFLLILAGVVFAFVAKVWARARLERDQALIPAALMRSQLLALKETLNQLPDDYRDIPVKIRASIESLNDELSDSTLDSKFFLPPTFPGVFGSGVDAAGYKAYLEARNPRVRVLSILVNDGVVAAAERDDGTLSSTQRGPIKTAIQNIDAITTTVPDQALQQVQEILTKLPSSVAVAAAASVPATASRTFEALQLEIQSISKGIWLLYGALTALSGLAVLILNNPGYGVPLDYVFAIFWGVGLPTAIQQLTPNSAASALNISIAKS
jgi:hypothetical protein